MLLTFGVLLSLAACAVIARMRIPGRVDAADLGWMSQQWLAEYVPRIPFDPSEVP